jgi:putative tryptophan/tyrosine transport system substrate-binding protein
VVLGLRAKLVRRREFILAGGAAAAWPLSALAQQSDRMRRIGVLMSVTENDPEGQASVKAFVQRLKELGWADDRTVRLDIRWGAGDRVRYRQYARELAALSPDVMVGMSSSVLAALEEATRTVPIVFVGVIDPVGAGLVDSMARPGGNATGFIAFEYAIAAKWLELLKEIAPNVTRAAVLRDPTFAAGIGQFAAIQAVAPIGMELGVINLQDAEAFERGVAAFARYPNGGLVVTSSPFGTNNPGAVVALASRYKLPAVYPFRYYLSAGGLASYGPNNASQFRPAAEYVDRILKGQTPAELPVQAPIKYETVVNLRAVKALGIDIPSSLLARADEVIE